MHKSTFGHLTNFGRLRSVYKSDVECRFLKFWVEMAKWLWGSRSITPIINTAVGIQRCIFGAKLVIAAQIHYKLSYGQAKFLNQNDKNDLEGQSQWPPFSISVESIPGCMHGTNLVIIAPIHYKLSCIQAKFPRILSQNGQNSLKGHGQWPPFSIPTESIQGCWFGANLMILAQICDELSCRQSKVYRQTDRWKDEQTQAMTIIYRPERPRGKKDGRMDGRARGWTDGQTEPLIELFGRS